MISAVRIINASACLDALALDSSASAEGATKNPYLLFQRHVLIQSIPCALGAP